MDHDTWQSVFLAALFLGGLWLLRRMYRAWLRALPTINYYARTGAVALLLIGAFLLGLNMRGVA